MWNNSFFQQAGEMRRDGIMIFLNAFIGVQGGAQVISSCVGRRLLLPSMAGGAVFTVPPTRQPPVSPSRPASSAWISTFTVSPQMGALVGSEVTEVTALGLGAVASSDVVFLERRGN